jgi:exodeoxyribonuclease-1
MADTTFFWHDYETFGRVPRRDRPAQFAGLRTDVDLNVIGQPVMHHCKPAPDFLPDPESCLLTGILPQHCLQLGVPEHQFAATIEAELGRPGTIGVGYNSIRFDDEVTRHLFWRNLIDPYAREWQNGCSRWDLLDVLRCTWALRPEGITWPQHDDGRPAVVQARAPDRRQRPGRTKPRTTRLSDVRATVAAGAADQAAHKPRLWDFCLKLRHKDAVRAEMGVGRPFLHLSGMYPVERGCMARGVAAGRRTRRTRTRSSCGTSSQDPSHARRAGRRGRAPTPVHPAGLSCPRVCSRLPIKTIHVNKSPVVIGNLKTLGQRPPNAGSIDLSSRAQRHAQTGCQLLDGRLRRRCGSAGVHAAGRVERRDRRRRRPVRRLRRQRGPAHAAPACVNCRPVQAGRHASRPSRTGASRNCCSATARATSPTRSTDEEQHPLAAALRGACLHDGVPAARRR